MPSRRASGILLHVSSLPSAYGVGDFGPAAYAFVDFLIRTGQTYWQILPLGPTGYGNSPYQSLSSFAGNPLFISLEQLAKQGWIEPKQLKAGEKFPTDAADFLAVAPWRHDLLRSTFAAFQKSATKTDQSAFQKFRERESRWLGDYTLFIAIKESQHDLPWSRWPAPLRKREPVAITAARHELADRIDFEAFIQFQFAAQWSALKQYAHAHGVQIVGDIPIFVAHDSADVWAHQDLFFLDSDGNPSVVAGVPPDYFSETGQLWGNPLYRWDVLANRGYDWWIDRLAHAFALYDLVRLDHFRGFEAYWEIPGKAETAINGRWVKGPGAKLFEAARAKLGRLPLIAEDLGVITAEVEALRDDLGLPGMRVLQFAFGDDDKASDYKPHNYPRHCVAYTGTHDNDTTVGWFQSDAGEGTTRTQAEIDEERARTLAYTGTTGDDIAWDMLRLAWSSVAEVAIAPLQDVLALGSESRMNQPGVIGANWRWRVDPGLLTPALERRLQNLTETYERSLPTPVPTPLAKQSRGTHP